MMIGLIYRGVPFLQETRRSVEDAADDSFHSTRVQPRKEPFHVSGHQVRVKGERQGVDFARLLVRFPQVVSIVYQ